MGHDLGMKSRVHPNYKTKFALTPKDAPGLFCDNAAFPLRQD